MAAGVNRAAIEAWPGQLARIDWQQPWFADVRKVGQAVASLAMQPGCHLADALNAVAHPIRPVELCATPRALMPGGLRDTGKPSALIPTFVAHSHMPAGTAYERFIFDQGLCPVREGLHDFFNGICWLHFPRIKSWLNQTQATQLANQFATQSGSGAAGAQRGPVRDALTVFDENGAMLVAPDALWQALAAKDWQRAFGALRPLWAQSRVTLVGHALLEKLVEPRKALTAHMIRAYPAINSVASLDEFLADDLHVRGIRAEPFAHLPVLGVPGWWEPNAHVAFYDDASVFRARRLA